MLLLALALLQTVNRINTIQTYTGTVASAGVSQQVMPADPDRSYLMCQSASSNTGSVYVDFGRNAVTTGGSVELTPGGTTNFLARAVPTTTVTITSPTAGNRWTCKSGAN